MLSKACVVGAYQRKLEEIGALGVDLTVVVPPSWKDGRGEIRLEQKFIGGYRFVVAPMRFNGQFHIHYYPSIGKHLAEARPDVVHVDEEPWDMVTFHTIREALKVGARPLFFTWQNLLRRYPPPFRWFEQYAFRHCAHAIAGNADAVSVLRAKGYRHTVHVIPQFGVDPELFRPSPCPTETEIFKIAYAGRLVREKGVDLLLRAAAGLTGDWQVCLAGTGPEKENLQRLAARLGIGERVLFTELTSTQMPDFYAQADVLVLPSRRMPNWIEQFGRVLIEAMACGVPVIGSDCGEIPNVIGDAGLIFRQEDVSALRVQLERMQRDDALRAQMRERSRARVLERYTQKSVARQTVEVYKQTAEGR